MRFLHHDQICDVIITFLNYDVKSLIVMQEVRGRLSHFNWTCGQGKYDISTSTILDSQNCHPEEQTNELFC